MKSKRPGQFAEAFGISSETFRRFVVLCLVAFWMGGFTFYAGVVIHTGPKIFGTHREIGFLTQQVSVWLNLAGVVTLLALMWNCLATWPEDRPLLRWGLGASWVVMVAAQVALYSLHPALDQMLDPRGFRIVDRTKFYDLHLVYLNLSITQWAACLVHLWCLVAAWRHLDRAGKGARAA